MGILDFLATQLADSAWSLGAFGIIAEFSRDAEEFATRDRRLVVEARRGLPQ
jgi:hypothetical protein